MLHWELRDGILVFLPAADVRRSVVSDLILILPSRQETSPLWDILLLICFCSRKIRVARHFHGKVKMLDSVCFHRLESQRSRRWTVVIEWNNKTILQRFHRQHYYTVVKSFAGTGERKLAQTQAIITGKEATEYRCLQCGGECVIA